MNYSEILAADCESTWMNEGQSAGEGSCDSKLSNLEKSNIENANLKNLEVEDTSANDLGIIFVSTIDIDNVKSQNKDKEGVPDYQKQLTLLNSNGGEDFDERAGCASREDFLVRAQEGCINLILDAPCVQSLCSSHVLNTYFPTAHTSSQAVFIQSVCLGKGSHPIHSTSC